MSREATGRSCRRVFPGTPSPGAGDPRARAAGFEDRAGTDTATGASVDREKGLTTQWQPIRTAPKDCEFLGFLQDKLTARIEICAWSSADRCFLPTSYLPNAHLWRAEVKSSGVKITYWMPIPNRS